MVWQGFAATATNLVNHEAGLRIAQEFSEAMCREIMAGLEEVVGAVNIYALEVLEEAGLD